MSFPLYDQLKEKAEQTSGVGLDVSKICTTITNIGRTLSPEEAEKHYRTIGALIIHHNFLQNREALVTPYEGKIMVGGKGILYQFDNLPLPLQQIIGQYVITASN